jgi:ribosomal protein L31E
MTIPLAEIQRLAAERRASQAIEAIPDTHVDSSAIRVADVQRLVAERLARKAADG